MTNSRGFSHAEKERERDRLTDYNYLSCHETDGESDAGDGAPSPTLDIIFYYPAIYPSLLKAFTAYCCQRRRWSHKQWLQSRNYTISETKEPDRGRNRGDVLSGGTFYHWVADSWAINEFEGKVLRRQTEVFCFSRRRQIEISLGFFFFWEWKSIDLRLITI